MNRTGDGRPLNHAHLARAAISESGRQAAAALKDPDAADADLSALAAVASAGVAIADALLAIHATLTRLTTHPLDT